MTRHDGPFIIVPLKDLALANAFFGSPEEVIAPVYDSKVDCPHCGGWGDADLMEDGEYSCSVCCGSGEVTPEQVNEYLSTTSH